jgi:dihydrofolate reductase
MRKIILFIATSLDGFIARENGEVDWLFTEGEYGYKEFFNSVDTVLMGGKTYRQILTFGDEFPYATKQAFVFTRDVNYRSNEEVTFIHHDMIEFVNELRTKKGKDIWLIGGSEINTAFLNAGLIDEMWLFVHPVILTRGIPLFYDTGADHWMKINDIEEFDTGLVKMVYVRKGS